VCGCEICFVIESVTQNENLNEFCSASGCVIQIDCVTGIHCYWMTSFLHYLALKG
jgi:hypothetical protein